MNALFLALAVAAGDAALPATAQAEASSTAPLALEQALDLARANPAAGPGTGLGHAGPGAGGDRPIRLPPRPDRRAPRPAGRPPVSGQARRRLLYDTYNATITLNQTLWDFGRTLGAYLAARDQERAARAGVDAAWNAVELNVRTAYYTVLATEALVAVADQTVASNQRQLDLARGQFDVGTRPRFDVTTADVNLQQSLISQITAHDGVLLTRIALSQAVGQDVSKRTLLLPTVPQDIDLDVPRLMAEAIGVPPRSQGRRAPDLGRRPEPLGREIGLVSHPRGERELPLEQLALSRRRRAPRLRLELLEHPRDHHLALPERWRRHGEGGRAVGRAGLHDAPPATSCSFRFAPTSSRR